MSITNIGNRREVLWDDFLIDKERTTATQVLNHPEKKEIVMVLDKPWEGDSFSYPHIVRLGNKYMMYFITTISDLSKMVSKDGIAEELVHTVSCLESKDGIHWKRPKLRNTKWMDFEENNIIIKDWVDNCFVFVDENPNCPEDEKIKALLAEEFTRDEFNTMSAKLCLRTSEDGIHFKQGGVALGKGQFDSLNTAHWNPEHQKYMCFYRRIIDGVRSVYYAESDDFKKWTNIQPLSYSDGHNFALYTNGIERYYRAPHILMGLPTRYVEREEWTPNYDQLPDAEGRKERMKAQPRYGLATTDSMFMSSRDGKSWNRFPEAFLSPGIEDGKNWAYGNCFLSHGMIETKDENNNPEISFFAEESAWQKGKPAKVRRYTIRLDGFASYYGKYVESQKVVTKPIIFDGNTMEINFKTSAMGSVYVNLLDENANRIPEFEGIELFGDSTCRIVYFKSGCDVSRLAGKPVRVAFQLKDAHIYSFRFFDSNVEKN